jgi:hypothetical protein
MPSYRVTETVDPGSQAPPVVSDYLVMAKTLRLAMVYALARLDSHAIAVEIQSAKPSSTH